MSSSSSINSTRPSNDELCDTAKLLVTVLDGASERAVLLANDGRVLHCNGAAEHFLYLDANRPHVSDFFIIGTDDDCNVSDDSWRTLTHCRLVMKDGHTTRTERNIHLSQLGPCPCGCAQQYYTAYICSKHEAVREAVDHAFDPVLTVDEKGIICTSNEAASELFGYGEQELVGHNISMICGGGHAENHAQYMQNYMDTGVKKIIGCKREVLARKKDGTEFPCQLGVQEIADVSSGKRYFSGFLKDLSFIKQHEAELQQRQDLAQCMIDASFDCMMETDENGVIQAVNQAACNMFGYTREEFVGSNISMICGDGHAERHAGYLERYRQTGERHIIGRKRQVMARRKDGTELSVELGVQEVVLATTGKKAFCGYIRDLTEKQKDKRALRKQQQLIHNKFFISGEAGQES